MDGVAKALADLETAMSTGNLTSKDEETICVVLQNATVGEKNTLLLQTIWIPPSMRRRGVCKQILDALERRADREHVLLAVGPLFADENGNSFLGDLCVKRGYVPCMPWCYVRDSF